MMAFGKEKIKSSKKDYKYRGTPTTLRSFVWKGESGIFEGWHWGKEGNYKKEEKTFQNI